MITFCCLATQTVGVEVECITFFFAHERLCLGWTHESGRDDIGMRKKEVVGRVRE